MIEIRLPGHPPGGNELHRLGHWSVRRERARWRTETSWRAREIAPERPLEVAAIGVRWRYRARRKRDIDNLVAGLKPIIDGLVDAGVIADDHSGVVTELGPLVVEVGAERDETVVVVRSREDLSGA